MGAVASSMAKFAFFPPNPPSYEVVEAGGGKLTMIAVSRKCDGSRPNIRFVLRTQSTPASQCGGVRNSKFEYDYSGYGQSTGKNTYANIEAAYKCLEEKYVVKEEDVILFGKSVGSGPTLDLATRLPRLRAVVYSPIMSGL